MFPLHPVGYAVANTFTMDWLWCATFVGWAVKLVTLRYGGMRAYARFRPFFLVMILGEFSMAIFWTALGALAGAPAPSFPWP